MSRNHGTTLPRNGLILQLDPANSKSYPGTGLTWTDLSTKNNSQTLINSPTFSTTNSGEFNFTTSGQRLSGFSSTSTGELTAIFFLKYNALNQYHNIFDTPTQMIWVDPSNKLEINAGQIRTQLSYANEYIMIACTFKQTVDPNTVLYVNGEITNILTSSVSLSNNYSLFNRSGGQTFNGTVGVSMFYDRVLSVSEITRVFAAHKDRYRIKGDIEKSKKIFGKRFNGYFNDNLSFFNSSNLHGDISITNELNNFTSNADNYSWMWVGYFFAPTSGVYTFSTTSDDASYLWVGQNAFQNTTVQNALVNNGGLHSLRKISSTITLSANTYYPIKIIFGEAAGSDIITVSFTPPGGLETTNGDGFYFFGKNAWDAFVNL